MDDVLAWFEESLRLRCEVLRTMYGAPDFASYAKALEQYTARVESPQLVCSNLQQRDEDDDEDTLEWLALELEKVAPMYVLAVAHRGGYRYTFVTNADKAKDRAAIPSWEFHVEKLGPEWKIVGQVVRSRQDEEPYRGRRHTDPIIEVRQINTDKLHERHAEFPGEIEVG